MTDAEQESGEFVSKSQRKRDALALKALGKTLTELPLKDLEKLPLSVALFEAIVQAQSMQKGALKRQIGTIAKMMASEDSAKIKVELERLRQAYHGKVREFHQLEHWRDALLSGDTDILGQLRHQFEDFDIQYVRQLVRNAQKEASQQKTPKSARLLFQYLKQCQHG